MDSIPWVEKYRPRSLDHLTQDQNLIDLFRSNVSTGNMTHFLFYGPPGTGKTSAILAIGRELFKEHFATRVIEFNASDDRGINAVREKITHEAKKATSSMMSSTGAVVPPYKIIILDEADSMTDEAQDALRVIIEQHSTVTRFCFICNYISKITDAIKSRCTLIHFKKLNAKSMILHLQKIAQTEQMALPEDNFHTIIDVADGDMRKAIMLLQNLKYLYDFKQMLNKPLNSLSPKEMKVVSEVTSQIDTQITNKDIYDMAATIDITRAQEIIHDTLRCKSIIEVSKLCHQIIAIGYPVDNVLLQLNQAILSTDAIPEAHKAIIIQYSGRILLKMKECSSEYIQLLDYLACVYTVSKRVD